MSSDQSRVPDGDKLQEIKEEVADIVIFTIYLCDVLNIDLPQAVERKIESNADKYPLEKAKGTSRKYKEL